MITFVFQKMITSFRNAQNNSQVEHPQRPSFSERAAAFRDNASEKTKNALDHMMTSISSLAQNAHELLTSHPEQSRSHDNIPNPPPLPYQP